MYFQKCLSEIFSSLRNFFPLKIIFRKSTAEGYEFESSRVTSALSKVYNYSTCINQDTLASTSI